MTATVILQLVEEGKLKLSDPIGKYVPGMPNGDTATIQQLAEMTSGIAPYTRSDEFQKQLFADPQKVWTPEELIAFEKGQPAEFAPGKGWDYSNTNYVLLGMVIEQVTGKSIADVFQERLFGPLGMNDTVFPGTSNAIADPHLRGATVQGQDDGVIGDATDWNPTEAYTAGEVISTLEDLETWAHALFTGEGILEARDPADAPGLDQPHDPAEHGHRRLRIRHRRHGRLVGPRRTDPRLHHRGHAQLRPRHHDHRPRQQRHPAPRREGTRTRTRRAEGIG